MPNISNIGAGMYTSLAYLDIDVVDGDGAGNGSNVGTADGPNEICQLFEKKTNTASTVGALQEWTAMANAKAFGRVREFPNLGIPANVVNVPQYGQATSSQISGQSDPPSMDFTFNYVPTQHAFINALRENNSRRLFRVRLANGEQIVATGTTTTGTNVSNGTDAIGTQGVNLPKETITAATTTSMVEFSDFYFFGSVASFEIVPSLTDSNQLNVSLTIDGKMRGPYSYSYANAVNQVTTAPYYGSSNTGTGGEGGSTTLLV